MGVYTSVFTWLWIAFYTAPQFNDIIHVDTNTSTTSVISMYLIVTIANALHSWSYYELIERTGNVKHSIYIYTYGPDYSALILTFHYR
jgi:hypothetical protein